MRSKRPTAPAGKNTTKAVKGGFSIGKLILTLIIVLLVVVILFTVGFFLLVQFTPFNAAKMNDFNSPTVVYDGNGQKYITIGNGSSSIPYQDIPKDLQNALVATEDHTFWSSPSSIDFRSILRAAYVDLLAGGADQGASTIQEQLAKMVYLTDNKSISYKVKQVVLGVQLSRHYTKQEILTMYLNRVFLGSNATGVEQAAKLYFGVDLRKDPHLTLDQAALLAGLPQAPSAYDPLLHPHAAIARRNIVLQNMANYGYISQAKADWAMKQPLGVSAHSMGESGWSQHPLFTNFLFDWAQRHGISPEELSQGGLKIYTTIDPNVQAALHQVFFTNKYDNDWPGPTTGTVVEGGAIFLDPKTGAILGAAGSRKQDYTRLGIDRVYSFSSPGSSIKPIMDYGPAIESGKWNYLSVLDDTPHDFGGGYTPENWNPNAPPKITLQYGIQWSQNVASVWLLQQIGIQNGVSFAENDGIPVSQQASQQLGIAIGGNLDVSPIMMAQAYEPFDDNGVQMEAHLINKIVNASGQVIYRDPVQAKQVMTPHTAHVLTRLMQDVVDFGTGQLAQIQGWGVAGKTGTVQYSPGLVGNHPNWVRTGWFDGYTPNIVGSIYIGYDVTTPEHHMSWVTLDPSGNAAELWRDVMVNALAGQTPQQFPEGPYPYATGLPNAAMNTSQPISGLQASYNASQNQVILNWKANGQNNGWVYQISRAEDSSSNASNSNNSASNTTNNSSSANSSNSSSSSLTFIGQTQNTTFVDPGVVQGNTYTYQVQAYDPSTQQTVGSPLTVTINVPSATLPNQGNGPGNNNPGNPPGQGPNGPGSGQGNGTGPGNTTGNNTNGGNPGNTTGNSSSTGNTSSPPSPPAPGGQGNSVPVGNSALPTSAPAPSKPKSSKQ